MNKHCPNCVTNKCPHPQDKDGNILAEDAIIPCFACPANHCTGYTVPRGSLCEDCKLQVICLRNFHQHLVKREGGE
jgi:hypothetical protein